MTEKSTYEELEKRVAELEQQVDQYKTAGLQIPPEELFSVLMEAFRYIPACKTFEDAAKEIFNQCKILTGAQSGYVALLSEKSEENEVLFLDAGGLPCDVDPDLPMPIRGLREIAYKTKDVAYDNTFSESPWMKYMPEGHVKLDNVLFAPLNIEDKTVGIIGIANKPGGFNKKDVHIAKLLGDLAAVALTYAISQDSLRESESRLKQAHKMTKLGHWDWDLSTGELSWSDVVYEIFGRDKEKFHPTTESFEGCIHPDDYQDFVNEREAALADHRPVDIEHRINLPDGTIRYLKELAEIIRGIDGHVVRVSGTVQDITAHKIVEKKIKESEQRYRTLFIHNPNPIAVIDATGMYLDANEAFINFVETPKEKLLTMSVFDFAPPNIKTDQEKNHKPAWEKGSVLETEYLINGKIKLLELSITPIVYKEINAVIGVGRDITEQKRTENALRENEAKYRNILKSAMDGFWLTDTDGRLREVNEAYCSMSGYSEAELLTMSIPELEIIESPELVAERMRRVIKYGSDRFESKHRRKDGTEFDVEVSIQFNSENGRLCTCFLRDITEQKRAVEEIRTANKKMKLASDSAQFGIWEFDVKANRLDWDDWMFRLYGINRDDFIGAYEAWQVCVHPDDLERSHKEVEDALRRKRDFDTEFRIVQPNGAIRHIKAYASVSRDSKGEPMHMTGINYDITEQKKAEIAIKETENRFRLAFMTSPDSININRLEDGKYIDINNGFTKIMGYTRDEVLGKNSVSLSIWKNPEDRKRLLEGLRKKGFVENLEAQFIGKYGRIRYGLMSARKITLNNEDAILSITRDITERKKVEQALKSSEKKWRNVLKNTPQIGISLNTKAEITFANEHFLALTGWKENEVIGQNWFDLFIPKNVREKVREVFHTVMEQKDTVGLSNYENEIVGKSGELFNVAWSNVLTEDAEGNVVDVTCLGVDLTERKRSEDKLKKSETKYRTMMEATGDPVYICSEDYKIQYMNQAMIKRVGHDATGESCYEALHGFDRKCEWCRYEETFQGGHTEKNIISPLDNRSFHVSSTVFVTENESLSKLSVFRDTTEFIELQNRLQQAQKMEAIGNLAGGIAHDFNNILFPIIGMSEMMMEDLPPNSLECEHANEINKAGHRAKELVAQILAFSRQSDQEKIPVRFQKVLKEVLKLCRSTIPANIQIEKKIQQDCGSIRGNATQLHQISMNLITNAYHAVQEKNGKIIVALEEVKIDRINLRDNGINPGKYLLFSVSDDGAGMTDKVKNKIFEPYFTTKEQGKGTGLGLAVVYGIVKEYGGEIEVDTRIGSGTTFRVYLPLISESENKNVSKAKTKIEEGHEHILLIDDEGSVARLEQQMLERLGYQITSLTSSLDAVEVFGSNPDAFDMVITDMTMPNITGDQLAKNMLSIKPDIPIIICTGFSERINNEQAELIGIKGFLMKPVVKSDMAQMVRKVLDETKKQ